MLTGGRCYECFRPRQACFCASIPRIDNRTELLILQHRREQFHRFNTARIVHKGLRNSQLLADRTANLAGRLQLKPGAGLLYPGPTARLLAELPADQRPQQLVVVDGTWHHAKTLVRDIPALQSLPRYQLAPIAPSRYRIRREPDATSLSTVEAAVAALQILEPDTLGLEQLLAAFETMVDGQLAHSGSAQGARFRARRARTWKNIPLALHGNLANIVVAYGEASPGEKGAKRGAGPPVSWVAQRLGDGASFGCTLLPPKTLSDVFLGHLELSRSDFAAALSLAEARQKWNEFKRPDDIVTVIYPRTAQLLNYLADERDRCLVLKSIDLELFRAASFEENCASLESFNLSLPNLGRATKRLAGTIAFVRYLNGLVNESVRRG